MIVILIPSHFEAKAFQDEIAEAKATQVGGADVVRGLASGLPVTLGIIGMGMPHAALRAEAVLVECEARNAERRTGSGQMGDLKLENLRLGDATKLDTAKWGAAKPEIETRNSKLGAIRGVILAGFAGALEPGMKRGDIFVTAGAEYLLPHLPEAERPKEAKLVTVEKIAGTAAAKKELFERTGAALCDMEQAHVAEIAKKLGVPFIGLRIISDEAQEDLPAETLGKSYDQETGAYTPWKLAGHLTRNPFRTVPLATFVRLLPPIRNRLSDRLHTWLRLAGSRLFE